MVGKDWLPVVGYEGHYEVSSDGVVRSLARVNRIGRRVPARIRSAYTKTKGYRALQLWKDGVFRHHHIHTLVAEAFISPRPAGMEVRHLDGNPSNNRLENLAWGTRVENMADIVRHGRNFNANKALCKYGHPFAGSNLRVQKLRDGRARRVCLACIDAKNYVAWNPGADFAEVAARKLTERATAC